MRRATSIVLNSIMATTPTPTTPSPVPTTPAVPPISPYGIIHGTLFQYHYPDKPSLSAIESSSSSGPISSFSKNKCILLGGLSDGLLPLPYTEKLNTACHKIGWSLVQPIISSSYMGFGHGSLQRDTNELCTLMRYLIAHHNAEQFAIVGHSTGCQNCMHFLQYANDDDLIQKTKFIALQGPVSDREDAMMSQPETYSKNMDIANKIIKSSSKSSSTKSEQEDDDEMMPRSSFWAPITATRFLSLHEFNGMDDYFSSDYTNEQLSKRLEHVSKSGGGGDCCLYVLVQFSGMDEYVPKSVNKDLLLKRLCLAMNGDYIEKNNKNKNNKNDEKEEKEGRKKQVIVTPLMQPNANHNLSNDDGIDAIEFVSAVSDHLKMISIGGRRKEKEEIEK